MKLENENRLLRVHLKRLRLPTILAECEKVAARCASDNVDHLAFLLQLCELELLERERRASDPVRRPLLDRSSGDGLSRRPASGRPGGR